MKRLIFHIDVNSAYLSWTAAYMLSNGYKLDLRDVASVVGGNEEDRHGIVLAKSILAKKYGIKTGETLFSARLKCKNLVVVPPRYDLFVRCSNAMVELLKEYTPHIQRFSCDECFLDMTSVAHFYKDSVALASTIKDRIKNELGFTVNIGISTNKLLAKVASDFTKPDNIHTLYENEIKEKMWPIPVGELFGVGRKTLKKLNDLGIKTIGDLALYDLETLKYKLKSYGNQIWLYANGIENSEVRKSNHPVMKGMGNSTTTCFDITTRQEAYMIITSLCESIGMRLRKSESCFNVISLRYKTDGFFSRRKQRKLYYSTDCTKDIIREAKILFDELWESEKIRQIGINITGLSNSNQMQITMFEEGDTQKKRLLDKTIDDIRKRFGNKSVYTAQFLDTSISPFSGGNGEEDYPLMSSLI